MSIRRAFSALILPAFLLAGCGSEPPAKKIVKGPPVPTGHGHEIELVKADGKALLVDGHEHGTPSFDDKPGMDIAKVSYDSDGTTLTITITFAAPVQSYIDKYTGPVHPVQVFIDADNDNNTGVDLDKNREGYEYEISLDIGVRIAEDEKHPGLHFGMEWPDEKITERVPSFTALQFIKGEDAKTIAKPAEQAQLKASRIAEADLIIRIPYKLFGLESGKKIRISTKESHAHGEPGLIWLSDLQLKLK